jgi:CheY-like chemotaxis protein
MKKSILVVEDEASLNDAYQMTLSSAGYKVYSALNGDQALKILDKNKVNLVLLDLKMPVLDGIGFLKKYKPAERKDAPKIIIFSNYDMQQEIDEAYALGADKYVLKAWASPKELLQIVKDII